MTLSMYQASVPVFQRLLTNAIAFLGKAEEHAEANHIDPAVLLSSRLYPDMLPLTRQFQIATDHAKNAPARLAGITAPRMEDTESSFPELKQRLQKTLDYIATLTPEQIDGSEAREITIPLGKDKTMTLPGQSYLLHFALPNFYFHITTAYAILRENGVPLGKRDFIGPNL